MVKFELRNVKFVEFLELSMSVSLVYSIIPQKCFAAGKTARKKEKSEGYRLIYFLFTVLAVIIQEMNLKKKIVNAEKVY